MARKPKVPTPPQSDNEDDEEAKSPHMSPRGSTPPQSHTPTQEAKIPSAPPSPKQSPPKTEDVQIPTPNPSPKQTTLEQTPPKQPPPTPTPKVPVSVVPTSIIETSLPPPPFSYVSISTTPFSTPIITPVTTTTIPEQIATVNISHTGAPTLDTLLADTKAYGGVVLNAFVETNIEQYTKAMDKSTDAVKESTLVCKKSSADVTESLKEEQTKFEEVRSSMKADNASLISSVSSKLDSLHADVAKEGALKEEIAQQASTIAVQKVQLD
ncbi:proline-rich receptor-like protein kinase PERK10 [Lactuca sativa]|uniref:proline-rich receptor-like protein kinase PERK10 n=1 Tax=Lactuca sativa TaxID=4236 RepID=UPI000CD97131|nr:proline-rich receptor-like protein kinase PERK10 [Lactuca sativa]